MKMQKKFKNLNELNSRKWHALPRRKVMTMADFIPSRVSKWGKAHYIYSSHTLVADKILIKWKATIFFGGQAWGLWGGTGQDSTPRYMTIPPNWRQRAFFEYKAAAHWMLEKGKRDVRNICPIVIEVIL